jgi:acid phosphatase type 7
MYYFIAALLMLLWCFDICFAIYVICEIRRIQAVAPKDQAESKSGSDSNDLTGEAPVFLVKPYLQLGTAPGDRERESLEIRWFAPSKPEDTWSLEVRLSKQFRGRFKRIWLTPVQNPVSFLDREEAQPDNQTQFHCLVEDLLPGEKFEYEVWKNGVPVFASYATARKDASQPYRFVAVGDMGEGKPEEMKIAHQISRLSPDFLAMPGDIAYKRGRVSEYLRNYFPFMNADRSSPNAGAPLLRMIPSLACLGNHDYGRPDLIDIPNLDDFPDLFGYFIFWSQPLNGADCSITSTNCQKLIGEKDNQDRFLQGALGRYPRMASFSYDYGNSHWLILDSNSNVDWTNEELQEWVRKDLSTSKATWKFVMFHQPPFTSHGKHGKEQRMRLMTRIFEECGVDIVFSGHAHLYERSYPLKFTVTPKADGSSIGADGSVDGTYQLDRKFDGASVTKPEGVIYLVTGAGGAKLQEQHLPAASAGWLESTSKHIAELHSFTVCDVDGSTLTLRQISLEGDELDRLTITK